MRLKGMKPHSFFLTLALPLSVAAQNTNSEKLQAEQASYWEQSAKRQEEWQKTRVEELQPEAEKGDASAQYELGTILVSEDLHTLIPHNQIQPNPEGLKWLRKAAEQENMNAQLELADWLQHSTAATEATKWLRAAANQGVGEAQFNLGRCYEQGVGVPTDYTEAANLYLKAANQGFHHAQVKLAECYREGKGVPRDPKEAYMWNFIAKVCEGRGTNDPRFQRLKGMAQQTSKQEKTEAKLTESELAAAEEEALRRLVRIAKGINASSPAE